MVHILMRQQAFAQKVEQAFDLWYRREPLEHRAFCAWVKQVRDTLDHGSKGSTSGGLGRWRGERPRFVDRVLKMSEADTMRKYGVPCGTGDPYWNINADNMRTFHNTATCSAVTDDTSAYSGRGNT